MNKIIITLIALFITITATSQNKNCEGKKIQNLIEYFPAEDVCVDSVYAYWPTIELKLGYDTSELDMTKYVLSKPRTFYLPNGLEKFKNLQEIGIEYPLNYVVFSEGINYLKHLYSIDNENELTNNTFGLINPLDSLKRIWLGIVTDSITKVPKILLSPNLEQIEIAYKGENFKFIIKVCHQLLKNNATRDVAILIGKPNYKYTKKELRELEKIELSIYHFKILKRTLYYFYNYNKYNLYF